MNYWLGTWLIRDVCPPKFPSVPNGAAYKRPSIVILTPFYGGESLLCCYDVSCRVQVAKPLVEVQLEYISPVFLALEV